MYSPVQYAQFEVEVSQPDCYCLATEISTTTHWLLMQRVCVWGGNKKSRRVWGYFNFFFSLSKERDLCSPFLTLSPSQLAEEGSAASPRRAGLAGRSVRPHGQTSATSAWDRSRRARKSNGGHLLAPGTAGTCSCIAKLPLLLPGLRLPAPCREAHPRDGLGRAFLQPGRI